MFGNQYVDRTLIEAESGYGLRFEFPDYLRRLHGYGARYRELAGLKPLAPSDFERALSGKESS
jgi:hypothetical protein